ncbi:hypothetical protein O181_083091 [Austropuccinia psidii MF-1]|uniref:Reverse transcriptase Ty1/copia-type domain-containing protein n=1 Tax=Austropuccinia psidii MF-1 TaxID=1389203 RepID=A0A9Q3FNE1_9BASI|nr:hypothetical protein [Austropuccinia psidii MF-1]
MTLRDVWEAVDKDKMIKKIGNHWVFNIKHLSDGTIEKFKVCFMARGDCQRPGVDCTKTYAPTASLMSLRLVLAHAVCRNWTLSYFDVSGAYLCILVKEMVFIEPATQRESPMTQEGFIWNEAGGQVLVDFPGRHPDSDGLCCNESQPIIAYIP